MDFPLSAEDALFCVGITVVVVGIVVVVVVNGTETRVWGMDLVPVLFAIVVVSVGGIVPVVWMVSILETSPVSGFTMIGSSSGSNSI